MIKIQKQKINVSKQNRNLLKKKIGAIVNFIGIDDVREWERENPDFEVNFRQFYFLRPEFSL